MQAGRQNFIIVNKKMKTFLSLDIFEVIGNRQLLKFSWTEKAKKSDRQTGKALLTNRENSLLTEDILLI
jgi:hypothetical protein